MVRASHPLPPQFAALAEQGRQRLERRRSRPTPAERFHDDALAVLAQFTTDYGPLVAEAARVVVPAGLPDERYPSLYYEVAVWYERHCPIRVRYLRNDYRPGFHQVPYLHAGQRAQFLIDAPEGDVHVYDDPDGPDAWDVAVYLAGRLWRDAGERRPLPTVPPLNAPAGGPLEGLAPPAMPQHNITCPPEFLAQDPDDNF